MRFLLFVFKKVLTSTKCCLFLVLGDTKFKLQAIYFSKTTKLSKHISFFCRNICSNEKKAVFLHGN